MSPLLAPDLPAPTGPHFKKLSPILVVDAVEVMYQTPESALADDPVADEGAS
jgi:hypothetical protein